MCYLIVMWAGVLGWCQAMDADFEPAYLLDVIPTRFTTATECKSDGLVYGGCFSIDSPHVIHRSLQATTVWIFNPGKKLTSNNLSY
jgi:hypothetical protein